MSTRGVQIGPVGQRVTSRAMAMTLAVLVLLALLIGLALFTNVVDIPASRVVRAVFGQGNEIENLIVGERLARCAGAVLVGYALGMSGGLTQTITRNPIASPDILGITAGAGLFAVAILTRPEVRSQLSTENSVQLLTPLALIGGLLTAALVLGLAWRGGFNDMRLILVGLSVNAIALAGISYLMTQADLADAQVATRWLVGSVSGLRVADSAILLPVVIVGTLLVMRLNRSLAALRLGPDIATALGTRTGPAQLSALLLAVALCGVAAALAGPVGFVAFAAPQIAQRLFHTAGPPAIAGGLVGAALVLTADQIAVRLPGQLPVGVLTAAVGAAYLVFLLLQRSRRANA